MSNQSPTDTPLVTAPTPVSPGKTTSEYQLATWTWWKGVLLSALAVILAGVQEALKSDSDKDPSNLWLALGLLAIGALTSALASLGYSVSRGLAKGRTAAILGIAGLLAFSATGCSSWASSDDKELVRNLRDGLAVEEEVARAEKVLPGLVQLIHDDRHAADVLCETFGIDAPTTTARVLPVEGVR